MGCKFSDDAKGEDRDFLLPIAERFSSKKRVLKCPKCEDNLEKKAVDSRWRCDGCSSLYDKGFSSYSCRKCNFDICPKCFVAPACPKQHPLLIGDVGSDWCCDGCSGDFESDIASRACRVCNYDLCFSCARKKKQENIEEIANENDVKLPEKKPSARSMKALFVGINYPGTNAQLNGCVNDIATMQRIVADLGVDLSDKRVLVDEDDFEGRTGAPTKQEILDGVKWLIDGAKAGDVLFFHYSGHGTKVRDTSGDEDDGYDEALVPGDYQSAGLIVDDDLFKLMCKDLPKGVRLTAITDCCHSGTILDLEYQFVWNNDQKKFGRPSNGNRHRADTQVYNRDFSSESKNHCEADVLQISGCKDDQTSADTHETFDHEYSGPGKAGGACTNGIAELVNNFKEKDDPKNLDISFGTFLLKLQRNLKARGYSQIPQMSTSKPISMEGKFDFVEMFDQE